MVGVASIGTSFLNTIFAGAVSAYLAAHVIASEANRRTVSGLALAHGYDTTFWWIAAILAVGAIGTGVLLRSGPLGLAGAASPTSSPKAMTEPGELQPSSDGSIL